MEHSHQLDNHIRDAMIELVTEFCPNVSIEPMLQPIPGETLDLINNQTGIRFLNCSFVCFELTCIHLYDNVNSKISYYIHCHIPSI